MRYVVLWLYWDYVTKLFAIVEASTGALLAASMSPYPPSDPL